VPYISPPTVHDTTAIPDCSIQPPPLPNVPSDSALDVAHSLFGPAPPALPADEEEPDITCFRDVDTRQLQEEEEPVHITCFRDVDTRQLQEEARLASEAAAMLDSRALSQPRAKDTARLEEGARLAAETAARLAAHAAKLKLNDAARIQEGVARTAAGARMLASHAAKANDVLCPSDQAMVQLTSSLLSAKHKARVQQGLQDSLHTLRQQCAQRQQCARSKQQRPMTPQSKK